MSVKVTTWVWEHSRSRGPARLVLLAIADNAHDDGAQAWPSMATLIRKTGLGERTVHRAVKQLVSMGELEVDYNAGPGLCNLYRVLMTPAPEAPPSERHPRQSGTPVRDAGVPERHPTPVTAAPLPPSERHPEPSLEPSLNRQELEPHVELATPARPDDPISFVFDAWRTSTGKARAQLDDKRLRRIKAALRSFPLEDVLDAVRGWINVPHNAGENDTGTVYNELTLLLRDAEHIERFRDAWRHGPTVGLSKATLRAVRTSQQMQAMRGEVMGDDHDLGRVGRTGASAELGLPAPARRPLHRP